MKGHKPGTDFTMRWWPVLVNNPNYSNLVHKLTGNRLRISREDLNIRKTQKQCEENCGIKRRRVLLAIDTAKFNYTGFTVYCQVLLDTILRNHLQSRSNLVYTHSIDRS